MGCEKILGNGGSRLVMSGKWTVVIANMYSLNVVVFEVDLHNPQEHILKKPIMVDPNNHDNVIYLLLHVSHYQRIITADGYYFMNDHRPLLCGHQGLVSCTELHSTTDNHSRSLELDFDSILDYASNDLIPPQKTLSLIM